MNRYSRKHSSGGGFSLVEILVALVIGLVATLVIMQTFSFSEGRKRTTTGGADAQTNSAVALYMMERDLRQAGYGMSPNTQDFLPVFTPPPAGVLTSGILAQCANVHAYKSNRATTPDFVYANSTFAPVVINPPGYPNGDPGTDVILVNYSGSGGMVGAGVDITQPGGTVQAGGDVPDYSAKNSRAGFVQGDMILAVPPLGSTDCSTGEITGLPVSTGTGQCNPTIVGGDLVINHNNLSYSNYYAGCVATPSVWNKPGAPVVSYDNGMLYNLGPVGGFVSRVYAVRNGSLTMCDMNANDCTAGGATWSPIAANVVSIKAQYGKDNDFNGTIDAWDTVQLTGPDIAKVVAVRLAVVSRSDQFEKATDFTAVVPQWSADAPNSVDVNLDVSASNAADWARYRYKVAQSIVPLRNMIWGAQLP